MASKAQQLGLLKSDEGKTCAGYITKGSSVCKEHRGRFCVLTYLHPCALTLAYSGGEGDCYVFSGWAWADSAVPETSVVKEILRSLNGTETAENPRRFDIAVELNYTDGTKETGTAAFTPSSNTWQYAAGAISAKKAYSSITVRVRYHYNANVVWFDGIGLFKEQFGTSYTYDEDGNIISVTDLQKQTTEYEYDSNDNVTKVIQNNKAKMTYEYDNYHNVTKATSEAGLVYEFEYDDYGNNTSVSIVGEDGVQINAISQYSQDGNQLLSVRDPLNRITYYEQDRGRFSVLTGAQGTVLCVNTRGQGSGSPIPSQESEETGK